MGSERKLKESPVSSKDDNSGRCSDLGYDLHEDFSQFLEEARKYATSVDFKSSMTAVMEGRKSKKSWKDSLFFWRKLARSRAHLQEVPTKISNTSSVSNLNCDEISTGIDGNSGRVCLALDQNLGPASGPVSRDGRRVGHVHSLRRTASISGDGGRVRPVLRRTISISGDGGRVGFSHSLRRTASGHFLSGCFAHTSAVETGVPYMRLNQHDQPHGVRAFGPIYLVT